MVARNSFNAIEWIGDAFRAGIFPRVNANGDLSLNVIDATPEDTEALLAISFNETLS